MLLFVFDNCGYSGLLTEFSLCVVKYILFCSVLYFSVEEVRKERDRTLALTKRRNTSPSWWTFLHGNWGVFYLTTALVQVSVQV